MCMVKVIQALSAFRETQVVKKPKAELYIAVHVATNVATNCSLESKLECQKEVSLILLFITWCSWSCDTVGLSGMGSYYMDGRTFLQCLGARGKIFHFVCFSFTLSAATTSHNLRKALLLSGDAPALLLQCRRIGEVNSVLQYTAKSTTEQPHTSVDVEECVIDRPDQFPGLICKLVQVSNVGLLWIKELHWLVYCRYQPGTSMPRWHSSLCSYIWYTSSIPRYSEMYL